MTKKERYIEWVARQEFVPLMLQPWWMDAVCAGKEWDVLLAEDAEGNIIGAMPYLIRKRLWFRYIPMPQMTQIGGLWVTAETTADRWACAEACRQMSEQLSEMNIAFYYQQFFPGSLCVEAMQALGFKTKERTTYRIEDLSSLDRLIDSFSKNKKRQLQKALSLHVERDMPIEDFYRFHTRCMEMRRRKMTYTREFLLVLERKARRLGQCQVLSICNADGVVYAAAFLVWDGKSMYFHIPCTDSTYNESGAGALLALEAMKLAREKHVIFDFEGSMDRNTAKEYKQFGSAAVKYYSVERSYRWWAFVLKWFLND